ncbi:MAG: leucine dehydrogenase [Gemmatimonadetes bacterium]|nr:leucine dehydrogenase [Gemmatimonadota bacterium]
MTVSLKSLIEGWEGIGVVSRYDQPTGSWIFIALHDDTLGMPTGGTRMKVYPSPALALQDAMRLAAGMTAKWAAVDLDFGGGKGVIAVPHILEGEERHGLLLRYGQLIESLNGSFGTGVDMGTTPEDMRVIKQATSRVHGVDPETGQTIDPGPFTARGVFAGMRAVVRQAFGTDDLTGRVVHIQGVGDVGAPLARMLKQAGARIVLSDLDTRRAESLAEALGNTEAFEPHTALEAPCDVYAPCAVGATLNAETIPELKCRAVVGSANNQLATREDADRLHERGILYGPDYIVNAGGAIAFGLRGRGIVDEQAIAQRIDGIDTSLTEILKESSASNESPVYAATRVVERKLGKK